MAKIKGMYIKRLIAAVMVVIAWCSVSAGAADWKPYAADPNFSYFYDANKIEYPYKSMHNVMKLELANVDIVRVRTKRIVNGEKGREWQIQEQKKLGRTTEGFESFEFMVVGEELNCPEQKYRVLSEASYTKDGIELDSFVREDHFENWKPIPPRSDAEALHGVLCRKPRGSGSYEIRP